MIIIQSDNHLVKTRKSLKMIIIQANNQLVKTEKNTENDYYSV